MSAVIFENVTKSFGRVQALKSLNLSIESGEFVSLLGPSGSGKSTTLNLLSGLSAPDGGDIHIGGKVVTHLAPDKRNIALVFQNYALYPHMTVFENLAFPLRARGRRFSKREIEEKVESVATILGVADYLARYPKELSGGQQQRVALGRAMIRDPQVFLLDEPLSNLDVRLRIRMRRDIKDLHARLHSTIVYVTHDQAEAMTLSTRVAVFNQGELQQFAPPLEVYNRPANAFVANFVGDREINFIEGMLRHGSHGPQFEGFGIVLPLSAEWRTVGEQLVTLGVRAEGLALCDATQSNAVRATVTQTELIGPDLLVYAATQTGKELCARADPRLILSVGDAIGLQADLAQLHLFDPVTTLSLRPAIDVQAPHLRVPAAAGSY